MPVWLAVCVLGVIEGVTEFLPISSTGHLLLVENSHWLPRQSDLFNITIQSGAALAVLFAFSTRVRELLSGLGTPDTRGYLLKLLLAFVITGAGGLVLKKLGFSLPKETAPIAWATLVGGIAILAIERAVRSRWDSVVRRRQSSRFSSAFRRSWPRAPTKPTRPCAIRAPLLPSGACSRSGRSPRRSPPFSS